MSASFVDFFKSLLLLIFSEECFDTFFIKYDFFHVFCLKYAVSKCLGYGIIGGSVLVKIPQIVKIVKNQSAKGISISSQILELYAVTAYVAYSYMKRFPFSSWGEGIFILAQTSSIAGLSLHYNKGKVPCFVFLGLYSIILYIVTAGFVALDLLWIFQATSVPVMFVGKMIQAFSNYRSKFMGQQSLTTVLLLTVGSLARVFTSVQETGDFIIILTYSLALLANSIVLMQFALYSSSESVKKPSRSKKRPQPPPKKKKTH